MSGLTSGDQKQGGFGQYLRSSSTLLGCGSYPRQKVGISCSNTFHTAPTLRPSLEKYDGVMKASILSLVLTIGLCATGSGIAQVGQDIKDAGHDTKTATEKGAKKSTSAVKKGYKKSTHATKKGIHKSADKVADKTSTT